MSMIKYGGPYTTMGYCSICKTDVSGFVMPSQSKVMFCGIPACKQGDIALAGCIHASTGIIKSGSHNVKVVGLPAVIKGSMFTGTYTGSVIGVPIG